MPQDKKVHLLYKGRVRRRFTLTIDTIACLILEDAHAFPGALLEMNTEAITQIVDNFMKSKFHAETEGSQAVKNRIYPEIHESIKEYYLLYYPKTAKDE